MNCKKTYFPCVFISLLTLSASLIIAGQTVLAQSALDRIETQIRRNADQSIENDPAVAANAPQGEQGYLGVVMNDQQDRGRGVRIVDIRQNGPAEKAGLEKQDLIIGVAGIRVRQLSELSDIIKLYKPDETVEFEILRDDNSIKIPVTFGRRSGTAPTPKTPATETIPTPPTKSTASETIPAPPAEQAIPPEPPVVNNKNLSDHDKLESLQKRVEQLERRIAELEQKLLSPR